MNTKRLILFSLVLHVLAAWFSYGRFHADEQFQVIEFAAYKTGVNPAADLPWEFHEQIRPSLQVLFAYSIIKVSNFIGLSNPFEQAFLMRLIFSLVGFLASIVLLKKAEQLVERKKVYFLYFLSLLWCFVPWFHARFSSENVAISFFIFGFAHFLNFSENLIISNKKKLGNYLFWFFLIGIAGVIRFQLNFFTIGLFLWLLFVQKEKIKFLCVGAMGVLAANAAGIVCDKWFYGKWVFSTWNYFYQNIILHKADGFGKESVFYYFEKTLTDALPPFSILIIVAVIYFIFVFRKSSLTWIIVPFLLAHFFTGHKELRFLFPLIPFLPLVVVASYQKLKINQPFVKFIHAIKYPFLIINFLFLLYLSFKPADDYTSVLKFLYNNYNSKPSVLFFENESVNPYSNAISLNFYRSKTILCKNFDEKMMKKLSLNREIKVLFISGKLLNQNAFMMEQNLVFSSLPAWLKPFNFNNWQERVQQVFIYELSPN